MANEFNNKRNEEGKALFSGSSIATLTAVTSDQNAVVAANSGLRLMGYSIKESAAVPALSTCNIIHGATVGGGVIAVNLKIALSSSNTVWFGPDGIAVPNGISVDWVAGQVDISIFYKVV